jgi:hypothetical protein
VHATLTLEVAREAIGGDSVILLPRHAATTTARRLSRGCGR